MVITAHNIPIADSSRLEIIDLTHTIDEKTYVWDGSCGFASKLIYDYQDGGFRGYEYIMRSCLGTHMDLPAHCFKDATDCSTFNIAHSIVPAYVIDVAHKAHEDYGISVDDIQQFENDHEKIGPNSLVFFATGWSRRWHNPIDFRNQKSDGIPHFPFVSENAARFLLTRSVAGIGIDTLSPDPFYATPSVHKLLLGAGKYIIESVANLESMPPKNAFAIVLPLKIKDGSESPIRLIGLVSK